MLAPLIRYDPGNQEQRESIVEQLERLLAHPVFKSSKRCPIFLRHVVERTLHSQTDHPIKERSIGVEVFGRDPGYDTNHDPIVRTTAGEVRKRIAQYYHEAGHDAEIRIELPAGSYVPEFLFPPGLSAQLPPVPNLDNPSLAVDTRTPRAPARRAPKWWVAGVAVSVGLVLLAVALERSRSASSLAVLDAFWNPVLGSSASVIVCIGQPLTGTATEVPKNLSEYVRTTDHIALSDGIALADLAGFLGKRGKKYRVQGSNATSLTDLRQGSAILIAGFDNSWTVRALDPLRFHFVRELSAPGICSIRDRQNPLRNDWSINYDMPYSKVTRDFAIIARFVDSVTDQTEVVAAGIGENGTVSAGEFLTNPRFLEQIVARAPRDWAHKNLEAVIETQVIDEKSGPPRLLAVYFW
jgi:hypothetical protein